MSDCKLITVRANLLLTNRTLEVNDKDPNLLTTVSDNPTIEKALNSYLKQGYRIVDRFSVEPYYFSFLLVRDN